MTADPIVPLLICERCGQAIEGTVYILQAGTCLPPSGPRHAQCLTPLFTTAAAPTVSCPIFMTTDPKREVFEKWRRTAPELHYCNCDELDIAWAAWQAALASPACPEAQAEGAAHDQNPPCSLCGGPHPFDTTIPSVRWNEVIRAAGLPDYLCLTCIVSAFVQVDKSFTADLIGGPFHSVPIEIRVRSKDAVDAQKLSEENTKLRAAAAPLPVKLTEEERVTVKVAVSRVITAGEKKNGHDVPLRTVWTGFLLDDVEHILSVRLQRAQAAQGALLEMVAQANENEADRFEPPSQLESELNRIATKEKGT